MMKTLDQIKAEGGEYVLYDIESGFECTLNGDSSVGRLYKEELEEIGFKLKEEGMDVEYEYGTEKRYEVRWQVWVK